MNKYTVDLAGMRVVQIASMEKPELDAKFINNAFAIACHIKADAEYQLHIRSLPSYPLQSVPQGWVQDMVVVEGIDFEIGWQIDDIFSPGWFNTTEENYNLIDTKLYRRLIAIPIVVSAAVEKFEQAIKEFGVDAAMEYFSTPDDAKEIIAKEIAESSPAGKEDEVKYLHELAAELRSLKQSIIESGLKKYFPVKDMSFHDKVVVAISTATDEGYWEKRAQAAEDVVKYWNSLGQVVRDDILHKWQSLLASPVAEAEGQAAVEFAEWAHDNKYIWHIRNRLWVAAWDGYKTFTTQQLYIIFIQSKNK